MTDDPRSPRTCEDKPIVRHRSSDRKFVFGDLLASPKRFEANERIYHFIRRLLMILLQTIYLIITFTLVFYSHLFVTISLYRYIGRYIHLTTT